MVDVMTAPFETLSEFSALLSNAPEPNNSVLKLAQERNSQLTKPKGALGRLEDLALWYAAWRGDSKPAIARPQVVVFAGNHGVTAQGISLFPSDVTAQMVSNFQGGGAAINQLSNCFGAKLEVHALDLDKPTQDFTVGPAMSEDDCIKALQLGWSSVDPEADLLVTGEMGIGNTTSAAAISLALYGGVGSDWAGRGTGLDDAGVALKSHVIERGLSTNPTAQGNGLEALRCLGGRELSAIAGAIARARILRIPVILDGFICCAAAACLQAISANAIDHSVAGHLSAEGAHEKMLAKLGKEPILSLGLRLGEGSGATLAIGVLKASIACHSGMATFAEAGVSTV